jgi:hypothetical protein
MMTTSRLDTLASLRNGQAIRTRLQWLENRLFWIGELNRSDLVGRFSISPQQASADIKLYQEMAPPNLCYDRSKKLYSKGDGFQPLFEKNCEEWLNANESDHERLRSIKLETVRPIKRGISAEILMAVSRAYRQRIPLEVLYQSMKDADASWRTICPHTIVETGIRWHIRAWVVEKKRFVDLVPGRILETRERDPIEWVGGAADDDWNTFQQIILVPSQTFSEAQREVIQQDYQMTDGRMTMSVRRCLVYYQLSSMFLVDAVREFEGEPQDRNLGLAVWNWRELMKFVKDENA